MKHHLKTITESSDVFYSISAAEFCFFAAHFQLGSVSVSVFITVLRLSGTKQQADAVKDELAKKVKHQAA